MVPVGAEDGLVLSVTLALKETVLPDIIDPDEGVRLVVVVVSVLVRGVGVTGTGITGVGIGVIGAGIGVTGVGIIGVGIGVVR